MSLPLVFPQAEADRLEPHLPPLLPADTSSTHADNKDNKDARPFVTLTFATSLDSALSLGPGIRTTLSGPQSKAMTHYLRSRHDAICVGVGTAIADDPGLNCRLASSPSPPPPPPPPPPPATTTAGTPDRTTNASCKMTSQPRPVVIDPLLRWDFTPQSKVLQLARAGQGLAPYIITAVRDLPVDKKSLLEEHGGKFIVVEQTQAGEGVGGGLRRFDWRAILAAVRAEGLRSIMVEGGGGVINSLLSPENTGLIDAVIVTIAPTWLGQGGVVVSPPRRRGQGAAGALVAGPAVRLTDTTWLPLGEDVVLCGRIAK